jgi:Icc protein
VPPVELTTVADDLVVTHDGPVVRRYEGLAPGTEHDLDGTVVRTLDRPPGELLARFATVNDVHFGEQVCGILDGFDDGPFFSSEAGHPPYPEVMNTGAVEEIAAAAVDAVVVKGDLTSDGTLAEYDDFRRCYVGAFGDRLTHVRGNHDSYHGGTYAAWPTQSVTLPGVTLAVLDTARRARAGGDLDADQLDWLDDLAAGSDRPVLVFGHHHVWSPDSNQRPDNYFGLRPDASEGLVEVVARRPAIRGYFAGHTHRNRVRRVRATGDVPYVEVACVKDFPGAWAEYKVYEGGTIQVLHRISTPDGLAWTEKTRQMFAGLYFGYAFGALEDRCFAIPHAPA